VLDVDRIRHIAPRPASARDGISIESPQRERGLWSFLTWSFFLSQLAVGNAFAGGAAQAATGIDANAPGNTASTGIPTTSALAPPDFRAFGGEDRPSEVLPVAAGQAHTNASVIGPEFGSIERVDLADDATISTARPFATQGGGASGGGAIQSDALPDVNPGVVLTPIVELPPVIVSPPVLGDLLPPILATVDDLVDSLGPTLDGLIVPVVETIEDLAGILGPTLDQVLSPIETLVASATDAVVPVIESVLAPVEDVVEGVSELLEPIIGGDGPIVALAAPVIGGVESILSPVETLVADATNAVVPVIEAVLAPVENVVEGVSELLEPIIGGDGPIVALATPVIDGIEAILSPVETLVASAVVPVIEAVLAPVENVVEAVSELVDPIVGADGPIVALVAPVIDGVESVLSPVVSVVEAAQPGIEPVLDVVEPVLDVVQPIIGPVLGNLLLGIGVDGESDAVASPGELQFAVDADVAGYDLFEAGVYTEYGLALQETPAGNEAGTEDLLVNIAATVDVLLGDDEHGGHHPPGLLGHLQHEAGLRLGDGLI